MSNTSPFANSAPEEPDRPSPVLPKMDVYRTGTISDVGLWLSDAVSPGKFTFTSFWSRWGMSSQQETPASQANPTLPGALEPPKPVAAPQVSHNNSYVSSWSKWLLGK